MVTASLALPATAHAGTVQQKASDKLCRVKERAADPTNIRQQARKPANPTEKRYILM